MKGPAALAATIARWDESEGALGRHSLLLGSLVVLLVALPLGRFFEEGGMSFSILLALVLVSAVLVNSPQRWSLVVASTIAIGAIAGLAVAETTGSLRAHIIADALGILLLGLTTLLMLTSLIYARRVSPDTIVGGICVYLMVGLCFAMVFGLICDVEPGAIVQGSESISRETFDQSARAAKLLYFSFVTLTTLGYGDIQPVTEFAQMMAVAEAVIGQLYLAIFVARLVALYVSDARHHPRLRPPEPDE